MRTVDEQAEKMWGDGPVVLDETSKRRVAGTVDPGGLAGWVLRIMRRGEAKAAGRHMRVMETMSLGGRRQLILVECDGQRFLVGSGVDRVETIVEVVSRNMKAPEETWV